MKHVTREGARIKIRDMSDRHLLNTIRLFLRYAKNGLTVSCGGGFDADDICYNEDVLYGEEAMEELNFQAYVREAKRRGLAVPSAAVKGGRHVR